MRTSPGGPKKRKGEVLLCPSARGTYADSVLIGVVGGTPDAPRIVPTDHAMPVTAQLLELAGPVEPTEVFRFASSCQTGRCRHFEQQTCQLARGGVENLPEVADELPHCSIRAFCRWFRQEGAAMCKRCPQIVTDQLRPSLAMTQIVTHIRPAPAVA